MKIDYYTCDVCRRKIDTDKTDNIMGQIKLLIKKPMRQAGEKKEEPTTALFDTKKISDLPKTMEYVEQVMIDLCETHAQEVLNYVTNARKTKDKAKKNNK